MQGEGTRQELKTNPPYAEPKATWYDVVQGFLTLGHPVVLGLQFPEAFATSCADHLVFLGITVQEQMAAHWCKG